MDIRTLSNDKLVEAFGGAVATAIEQRSYLYGGTTNNAKKAVKDLEAEILRRLEGAEVK